MVEARTTCEDISVGELMLQKMTLVTTGLRIQSMIYKDYPWTFHSNRIAVTNNLTSVCSSACFLETLPWSYSVLSYICINIRMYCSVDVIINGLRFLFVCLKAVCHIFSLYVCMCVYIYIHTHKHTHATVFN